MTISGHEQMTFRQLGEYLGGQPMEQQDLTGALILICRKLDGMDQNATADKLAEGSRVLGGVKGMPSSPRPRQPVARWESGVCPCGIKHDSTQTMCACPFCGCDDPVMLTPDESLASDGTTNAGCEKCGALGPEAKDQAESVAKWNARALAL